MEEKRSDILKEAQNYAEEILKNRLSDGITYHSLVHTQDVVNAVKEIAKNSDLTDEEAEIVELAAWFHDLGYTEVINDHEKVSANLVLDFLSNKQYNDEKSARVVGCIMATKMPQSPKNKLEAILCDADMIHLGKENYFDRTRLLQEEVGIVKGAKVDDAEWLSGSKKFIESHRYFTDYAKNNYNDSKKKNLKAVKNRIKKMKKNLSKEKLMEEEIVKLKEKVKKAKQITPTRGIETMFRLTSKNHMDLSAMADAKANIMISVNSIILSVLVSVLFRKLEEYPYLTIPAFIMTIVCLTTIVLAILATRPNVSKGTFTQEDIRSKKTNLMFFGNFHRMDAEEYEWGMKEMMKDADYLYTSLIRDVYFLGVVLGKKYSLLRKSYTIFMYGFVIAVLSFMVAELFFKEPLPY